MKKLLITTGLAILTGHSYATQPHMALIDVSYIETSDDELSGEQFRLQLPVKQGLYVSYERTSLDGDVANSGYKAKSLGGGVFWGAAAGSSMYIGYKKVELDLPVFDDKDVTRYELGWRRRLTNQLELNLEYNQTGFDMEGVDEDGYQVGIHYYFSPTFAVTFTRDRWFEQDRTFLGVRFTSGK
ncbi:hypothetical protein [Pleionea sediminis]|uniref:hypothetical protein n=1 Tax=Pleionea sediminis TaxID=2569479 RepID=UPI001184713A|nr:hypothetical protein [Pleionea sediminis]